MIKNKSSRLVMFTVVIMLAVALSGASGVRGDVPYMLAVGGTSYEAAHAVRPTPDGGCIVAGVSNSLSDVQGDLLLLKYDSEGVLEWSRSAGVWISLEIARDVRVTSDGGYIVAGETYDQYDFNQIFLLKYSASGSLQWARTLGGDDHEWVGAVIEDTSGNFVVTGSTESYGLGKDVYLARFSSSGTLLSFNTTGSGGDDEVYGLCQTQDGGFIAAGETTSYDANGDALLVKFSFAGSKLWVRTYGGEGTDVVRSVTKTADGNLIAAGETDSFGEGYGDVFLLKIDDSGGFYWAKTIGGVTGDGAYDIDVTADNGYVISGYTASFSHGDYDAFLIKCDSACDLEGARALGGSMIDMAYSGHQTSDGGYLLAGLTATFGAGVRDIFLMKTDSDGLVPGCEYTDVCGPVQNTISPTDQAHYPPAGVYAMSASSPSVSATSPIPPFETLCGGRTVSAELVCGPPDGILPFTVYFEVGLTNEYTGFRRKIAARIQAQLASGTVYPNWKHGTVNIDPGTMFMTNFNQTLPAYGSLLGTNVFTLVAEDVTPAPYNQAPHPPAGDTDSDVCTVYGLP